MTSIQGLLVGYLLRKNLNTNISNKKHSTQGTAGKSVFLTQTVFRTHFFAIQKQRPATPPFSGFFAKKQHLLTT